MARNIDEYQSPWELLGIEEDATERQVRSAYARLLKTTRPDDDAVAFQALVEARDYALMMARHQAHVEALNPWEEAEEHGVEPPQPAAAVSPQPETLPAPNEPAPAPRSDSHATAPGRASTPERPETRRSDVPRYSGSVPGVAAAGPMLEEPADTDLTSVDLDEVVEPIRDLLRNDTALAKLEEWPRLVAGLGALHHDDRGLASSQLLAGLPLRISVIAHLAGPEPRRGPFDFLTFGKAVHWAEDRKRARLQADVLVALDEEFGWTDEDRQVFAALDSDDAVTVLTALQGLARAAGVARHGTLPAYDSNGLPVLEPRDLQVYFGDTHYRYAQLLARARAAGRWTPDWSYARALMLPIQALGHRHWDVLAAWAATLVLALYVLATPQPLIGELRRLLAGYSGTFTVLALLPLGLVHAWYGAYGYSRHFVRLRRLVSSLDAKRQFSPPIRAMRLQRAATTGGETRTTWPWQGTRINKIWFVVFLLFVLSRILFSGQSGTPPFQPPSGLPPLMVDQLIKVQAITKRRDAGEISSVEADRLLKLLIQPDSAEPRKSNMAPSERFLDPKDNLGKIRAIEARRDAGEINAVEAKKLIDALFD